MDSHAAALPGRAIVSRGFLGLAMMEFWERFAMAGIKSLLVLMLVDDLLAGDQARVEGVVGFRRMMEALLGPLSTAGVASQIYGAANALIYLSIPLGGLFGDVIARRSAAVYLGGIGMLVGLLMMLSEAGFLLGLGLFAIGTGVLKGNLSAQVGQLFQDEAERQRGYSTYLGFLNAGVICGPLACGGLAALFGWRHAIAGAALAIAIGLVSYRGAGGGPVAAAPAPDAHAGGGRMTSTTTLLLIVALLAVYLCYSAYDQLNDIFLLWARARIDLRLFGMTMQAPWFLSLDGLFTLLLIPVGQLAFGALQRRGIGMGALHRIMLGGVACAAGYLVLALGETAGGDAPLGLSWALLYLLLIDAAIVLVWPSALSLITGIAPPRRVGLWVGLFYLHGFVASLWVGMSGALYGRIPTTEFWLLHAALAGASVLLLLVVGLPLLRALSRRDQATITSACAKARA